MLYLVFILLLVPWDLSWVEMFKIFSFIICLFTTSGTLLAHLLHPSVSLLCLHFVCLDKYIDFPLISSLIHDSLSWFMIHENFPLFSILSMVPSMRVGGNSLVVKHLSSLCKALCSRPISETSRVKDKEKNISLIWF